MPAGGASTATRCVPTPVPPPTGVVATTLISSSAIVPPAACAKAADGATSAASDTVADNANDSFDMTDRSPKRSLSGH